MAISILLVDDSAVMRAMIRKTLGMCGIPVGATYDAANGEEALALLHEQPIDLVFLDISMPVMRGDEVLERMRAEPQLAALPVIVVSSESSAERASQLEELGAAFIHKPFSPQDLRTTILNAMGATR
jgi:two-component system, chemotaxis family, chemotaxis protein CheY